MIERLKALCDKHGADVVAETAHLSLGNLKQILAGTLLPKTNAPRGVGPSIQKRLERAYPGWSELPPPAPPPAKPANPPPDYSDPQSPEWQVINDLNDLHPDDRADWIRGLRLQADKAREIGQQHIAAIARKKNEPKVKP